MEKMKERGATIGEMSKINEKQLNSNHENKK